MSSREKTGQKPGIDRRAPRERAFLQAIISFAGGAVSFPCFVTQISASGAKIALDAQISLPEHFHIAIPQKGVDREARLVWRNEVSAALVFDVAEKSVEYNTRGLERRLRAVEAENALLRTQVASLTARLKHQTEGY